MGDERKLRPGHEWAPCLCLEIDPRDRPRIVCDCWTPESAPAETQCRFMSPPGVDVLAAMDAVKGGEHG